MWQHSIPSSPVAPVQRTLQPLASRPSVAKLQRVREFSWSDTYLLIELLEKHGKNWGKVLEVLHKCSHRYTDLKDKNQLRDYYTSLLGARSIINLPFVAAPWEPSQEDVTPQQAERSKQQHEANQIRLCKEREAARIKIKAIEDREILLDSSSTTSEQELRRTNEARAKQRASVLQERRQEAAAQAKEDIDFRSCLVNSLQTIMAAIQRAEAHDAALLLMLQHMAAQQGIIMPTASSTNNMKRRRVSEEEESILDTDLGPD